MWCLAGPVGCEDVVRSPAGLDSELPLEIPDSFVQLPFVRPPHADVSRWFRTKCNFDFLINTCSFRVQNLVFLQVGQYGHPYCLVPCEM